MSKNSTSPSKLNKSMQQVFIASYLNAFVLNYPDSCCITVSFSFKIIYGFIKFILFLIMSRQGRIIDKYVPKFFDILPIHTCLFSKT